MTDNEIIKALESCTDADDLRLHIFDIKGNHTIINVAEVIDLIKHQQAEIERLENVIESNARDYVNAIERMLNAHHLSKQVLRCEVAKEFAEKLKEKLWSPAETWLTDDIVTEAQIDEVLKEMVGANNDR